MHRLLSHYFLTHKINIFCFAVLFMLSFHSNAQINRPINKKANVKDEIPFFSATNKINCLSLPFGYGDLSKRISIDSILSAIQDESKWKEINSLKFEKVIKKNLLLLPEEYDVLLPFAENFNEKYDQIKIASQFLCYRNYTIHFVAVFNAIRYTTPFIEKIYLVSTKDNKPVDMMRIYLHHEGEMGFSNYTLFNIDKNYIISLQDYEFTEYPFKLKPLNKYQVLHSGKFSRYYDHDGPYKDNEEQGLVKNHLKEGKWIEFKLNSDVDLKKYPEFTDSSTYLEAVYKNGLPTGKWTFYKLLQRYSEETGEPILNSRKKGQLIYTETYREGMLEKREF